MLEIFNEICKQNIYKVLLASYPVPPDFEKSLLIMILCSFVYCLVVARYGDPIERFFSDPVIEKKIDKAFYVFAIISVPTIAVLFYIELKYGIQI